MLRSSDLWQPRVEGDDRVSRRNLALVVVMLVAASLTVFGPTQSFAGTVHRSQVVIPLAGDVEQACDELIRFTAGEVRITEQEVVTASGGIIRRYLAHTAGVTAVGVESGLVYRDHTTVHEQEQFNTRWFATQFEDGSHGVNVIVRIRVFAPGTNANTFVERFDFHLRRVEGLHVDPRLVHDRQSQTCV